MGCGAHISGFARVRARAVWRGACYLDEPVPCGCAGGRLRQMLEVVVRERLDVRVLRKGHAHQAQYHHRKHHISYFTRNRRYKLPDYSKRRDPKYMPPHLCKCGSRGGITS